MCHGFCESSSLHDAHNITGIWTYLSLPSVLIIAETLFILKACMKYLLLHLRHSMSGSVSGFMFNCTGFFACFFCCLVKFMFAPFFNSPAGGNVAFRVNKISMLQNRYFLTDSSFLPLFKKSSRGSLFSSGFFTSTRLLLLGVMPNSISHLRISTIARFAIDM